MTDEKFSLEQALERLEEIVRQLESGEQTLDEAVALFEEGQKLVQSCEKDLEAKGLQVKKLMPDGSLADL